MVPITTLVHFRINFNDTPFHIERRCLIFCQTSHQGWGIFSNAVQKTESEHFH